LVITGWLVVLALAFLWPEFCGVYICAARFRLLENIEATANIVRKDKANPTKPNKAPSGLSDALKSSRVLSYNCGSKLKAIVKI